MDFSKHEEAITRTNTELLGLLRELSAAVAECSHRNLALNAVVITLVKELSERDKGLTQDLIGRLEHIDFSEVEGPGLKKSSEELRKLTKVISNMT